MQSKGFIKWVAILLSVACLYELSFTFVTKSVENDAVEYAESTVARIVSENTVSDADRDSINVIVAKVVLTAEESAKIAADAAQQFEQVKKFNAVADADSEAYIAEATKIATAKLALEKGGILSEKEATLVADVVNKYKTYTNLLNPKSKTELLDTKEKHYLDSVNNKVVYNLLGMPFTYKECKENELNLGLDLKGGMNITLGVQVGDVIKSLADDKKDTTMLKALKAANAITEKETDNYVDVFVAEYNKVAQGQPLAVLFDGNAQSNGITSGMSNNEVIDILKSNAEAAIEASVQVIGNRIDRFGVVQPNIQRIQGTNRIMVELPGIKDPKRVEKLLSGAASLEFWPTYSAQNTNALNNPSVIIEKMQAADAAVQKYLENDPTKKTNPSLLQVLGVFNMGGGIIGAVETEAQQNVVSEYLSLPEVNKIFGDNVLFMWSSKPSKDYNNMFLLYAIYDENADGKAPLDGSVVKEARANYSQYGSDAEVSMTMNGEGARKWANITEANKDMNIAIVLDGCVYSAPVVRQKIDGGNSSISGDFSIQEAQDLANILKSGKVPASSKVLQKEIVGPSLGQKSISAGLLSIVLAFVLVLIYMALFYRTAGLYADLALIFNIFLLIGCFVSLGAALTLPGIAGIVLTMGMAVDANVIIFERIKEELRGGKGIYAAIKDGFSNAYSAIIDGNLTTIITGVVLFLFGTGPVKGFATTLIIGILTSAFTAIFITRLLIDKHVAKHGKISFSFKWSENMLSNLKFDFIGKRFIAYAVSAVVIVAGAISLTTKGLNLGVEFTGGSSYVVNFDQPISVDQVRIALNDAFEKDGADAAHSSVEVKQYGGDTQVRIVTQYKPSNEGAELANQPEVSDDKLQTILYNSLKDFYKKPITMEEFVTPEADENVPDYGITSSSEIGPAIAKDMTEGAVFSILFALVAIGLYIIFRFRKWQWAAGATVALAHDAFMIIALFSLLYSVMPFNLEVNQAFIAAILTIIGYSINDTVVIFDRIREYLRLYPKRDLKSTINLALSSTMMRTLNTSGTTLITLLAIFTFGGEAVRGFVFALIIGIVVGTYSSLFIASPLAYDMQRKKAKKAHQE